MAAGWSAHRLARRAAKAHDAITALGFQLSKLCLAAIVFSFSLEVVARYLLGAPIWWANEAVSYALCIGVFLAMPEVTRAHGHVAVTIVPELLPPQARAWLEWMLRAIGFVVCALLAWISLTQNIAQYVRDVRIIAAIEPIPQVYISSWITYGFFSSALYFLRSLDWRGTTDADPVESVRL